MPRRVVITGEAALTPASVSRVSRFDATGFPVCVAAELRGAGDQVAMGLAAARAATGDGDRLRAAYDPKRIGVFIGAEPERIAVADWAAVVAARRSSTGIADFAHVLAAGAYERRSPARLTDAVADLVSARGPRATLSMACVSSAAAIAAAHRAIVRGDCDCAIAGGAALNVEPLLFAGFCLLGAMSQSGACRPFDVARDGFVLGDAAAMLVLEEESAARGAEIRGRILGAGESVDAFRMTDPAPGGRGAALAIGAALASAGIAARDVALVKAHATGTRKNDEVEARVVAELLPHRPPILAVKGALGHSIAASGAVELLAALAALRARACPPVQNLHTPDGELPPLALTPDGGEATPLAGSIALCNTFGFGGINCSLVVASA